MRLVLFEPDIAQNAGTLFRLAACLHVPVDLIEPCGFHLDDRILIARGERARKGAPHTFDVGGYCAMLDRLRSTDTIYAPAFDRDLEVSRGGAIEVPPSAGVVLTEGNWLLHDREGWEAVRPRLDRIYFMDVSEMELARRLWERWEGYGMSPEEISAKVEGNDLPNARLVADSKRLAHEVVTVADLD